MNNIFVASFTPYSLFERQVRATSQTEILFEACCTIPQRLQSNLICVICDFDDDVCEDLFYELYKKYSKIHFHVFIWSQQKNIRGVIDNFPGIQYKLSYTALPKHLYGDDEVRGSVLNFLTPLCSRGLCANAADYVCLEGRTDIEVFANLAPEEIRKILPNFIDDEKYTICALFGSGYKNMDAEEITDLLEDEEIATAFDFSKPYNRVFVIRGDRNYAGIRERRKLLAATAEEQRLQRQKEIEEKFDYIVKNMPNVGKK